MIKYGLISETDGRALEKTIDLLLIDDSHNYPFNITEIGCYGGDTGRGICEYVKSKGRNYWITGIDSFKDKETVRFPYNEMIYGNSNEVYNKLEARKKVSSKAEFYKLHADSGYIMPTVLDKNGIKDLKFPIVAKPDNEHSGLGIQVFKSKEELDDADLSKFSSFSEKIDIKEEHRFFVWRGEMIQ